MLPSLIDLQPAATARPVIDESIKNRVITHCQSQGWFEDTFCGQFEWRFWRSLPPEAFDCLSLAERIELWQSDVIQSELGDYLRDDDLTRPIEKVRLCLWYYGCVDDWNELVRWYTKVCTFDLGLDGFSLYLDWPRSWQGFGTGECFSHWLDGGLAYILYYKGSQVGRIGFSAGRHGILIQQVQANAAKGNRWMYRLGCCPLSFVADRFSAHFEECDVWIVDGATQVDYLQRIHPATVPFPLSEQERIRRFYDKDLVGFRRTAETHSTCREFTGGRLYHKLERTQ